MAMFVRRWASTFSSESGKSIRSGAIGVKVGMTHTWNVDGKHIPLTAIRIAENQVLEVRTKEQHGVDALVVGGIEHNRPWKLRPSLRNMFASKNIPCKKEITQFKVSPDNIIPQGDVITTDHFQVGQFVDIVSTTIGKGTAGVMKRHNMGGGNASHGGGKMNRKMGATGGGTDPGRVWKGKRMAGHMGCQKVITHSLMVYKIDPRWDLLFIIGSIPGKPGTPCFLTDARRRAAKDTQTVEGVVPGIQVALSAYEPGG
eukprot:m.4279 g.4279  ORF g.4279 m.4279 type:complete len:257 (-) comp2946_c0_seq1:76-846(-)